MFPSFLFRQLCERFQTKTQHTKVFEWNSDNVKNRGQWLRLIYFTVFVPDSDPRGGDRCVFVFPPQACRTNRCQPSFRTRMQAAKGTILKPEARGLHLGYTHSIWWSPTTAASSHMLVKKTLLVKWLKDWTLNTTFVIYKANPKICNPGASVTVFELHRRCNTHPHVTSRHANIWFLLQEFIATWI